MTDILLSITTGLALRLFLNSLDNSLGRSGPVLVGLWEGVTVHHQSTSSLRILDHYLAYALRVAVDFYFISDLPRELIILLFTVLSLVASETLHPTRPRRVRHRRSSRRSVPTHIRHCVPRPLAVSSSPIRPSCPPTPPSIFLEGESESNLAYSDNLTGTSAENNDKLEPFPFSTSIIPLLTPPCTLLSEVRDSHVVDRLSTIEEHSSDEEGTRRSILEAVHDTSHNPSHASSVTKPLPVPNLTIRYIHGATPAMKASSLAEAPPLPVPNISTKYYMSEDDDGDPLQTPPLASSTHRNFALTDDDDDGLTTPAHELSPLVLEHTLLQSLGQVPDSVEVPIPSTTVIATSMEVVTAQPVPSAVEYPSTPVVRPQRDPDPAPEPIFNSGTEVPESQPQSGPELCSTLSPGRAVERHGHDQHETNGDSAPDGIRIEDTGQETETEIDAASMISSHPAAIMYSRAEVLRSEARAAEAEHIRLKKELQHIHGVKVLFVKQQMQEQEDLARRLHGKAAKRFFKARNDLRRRHPHEVDVHGLRVAEAVQQTEHALRHAYTNQASFVRVIVGKGLHSAGKPVLKEAITKIMDKHGIPCSVDPRNAGVLVLSLPVS
ncbi:hypothetical protein H2248_004640 [Termitomyces sp. 'cryptogamus']|nr:hypothetical protein H2248_004640 [Termitomyces sp. 'cryptogamus']